MMLVEAALVLAVLAALVYLTLRLVERSGELPRTITGPGAWRVGHYDVQGTTKVVLQKVAGGVVVDEHLVASLPCDDPAYDERFLAAMASARERLALFESEE